MPLFFSYHLPLNSWQWIVGSSWVLPQHQCIPGTCQTEPILIVCKLPFDLEFLLSFIEECFQQDSAFSAYKLRATKRFWGPFCAIGPPFPLSSCRQSPCPYCLLLLPAQAGWLMQLPHLSLPAPTSACPLPSLGLVSLHSKAFPGASLRRASSCSSSYLALVTISWLLSLSKHIDQFVYFLIVWLFSQNASYQARNWLVCCVSSVWRNL